MKKHWKPIAAGVAVLAVVIVLLILTAPKGPPVVSNATPGAATSSAQQQIDTGLSLAPSSTPTAHLPPSASLPLPLYQGCKLSLTFAITGGNLQQAGPMQYSLIAKNLGSGACQSASISVYYATGEKFSSSNPPATSDGYYWQVGNLSAGAGKDISLTTTRSTPLGSGDVTNEACLSASNGSDACSNSAAGATAPSTPAQTAAVTSYKPAAGQDFGIWEWTPVDQMTSAEMQSAISAVAANHFNAIYLTVDDYLTLENEPAGAAKTAAVQSYNNNLAMFLLLAAQKGIAVDAEAGARNWAESGQTQNAPTIIQIVSNYNQSHAQKFRGVQYDIEPYLLPQYQTDQSGVLTDYVDLVASIVNQDKSYGLPLAFVVPLFFDANLNWTPQVTEGGTTDYTYRQVLRLLGQLPPGDGRIIEMSYRNFTNGSDGAISLSENEISEADATTVKVIIAQETGPVTPSYVTFNGLSKSALYGQLNTLSQTFARDKSFGGVAVDYLDPFLQLPN